MGARETLRALIRKRPNLTIAEALTELGVSRQRLHVLLREEGITLQRSARSDIPRSDVSPFKDLPSGVADGLPPYAVNGIKEMIVAVDLLRKGYDVYRSLTAGGLCDLVVVDRTNGKCTRLEVKSASVWRTGRVSHSPTGRNSFDALALVFKDGSVEYRPPIQDW